MPVLQSLVPILRVALETARSSDLVLLATAGEVYLQHCLKDLTKGYAKHQVTISEPMEPFRKTFFRPPDIEC